MSPAPEDRPADGPERPEDRVAQPTAVAPVGDHPAGGGPAAAPTLGASSPPPGVPPTTSAGEFLDSILANKSDLYRGSREVLRDSYVPSRLPHREEQIRQVSEVLAPALRGAVPSNLLIYGKIGTGKTAVVAQVRQDIQRRTELAEHITFVPINCGNIDTAYSLLQNIGNTFARTDSERIPTGWALDRVQAAMRRLLDQKGGTILLLLDEIDRLVARSGDNVLYTLSQINTELEDARLVLVGISNDSSSRTTWTPGSGAGSTRRRSCSRRTTRSSSRTSCASGPGRRSGRGSSIPASSSGAPRTPPWRTGTRGGRSRCFGSRRRWPSATTRSGSPPTTS